MKKGGPQPEWLAELTTVDWARYPHAHGEGNEIPALIRQTLEGGQVAAKAAGELYQNLNHQGSIYPATVPAVRFLIEMLNPAHPDVIIRRRLLSLLGSIAAEAGPSAAEEVDWMAANPGKTYADPEDPYAVSFVEALLAVWQGVDVYCELLEHDPSADVRMYTAYLLGQLADSSQLEVVPDDLSSITNVLTSGIAAESDTMALSSIAFALGRTLKQNDDARDVLRQRLNQEEFALPVVVAAALALVESDDAHTESDSVDILMHALMEHSQTDGIFQPRTHQGGEKVIRYLPWIAGKLRFRLCRALCDWSAGDADRINRVLPPLICCIGAAGGYTAESDLGPIMRWLWPGRGIRFAKTAEGRLERVLPPSVQPSELTTIQRRVLEACYANAGIWKPKIGNTSLVFENVGLPPQRSKLKSLLK